MGGPLYPTILVVGNKHTEWCGCKQFTCCTNFLKFTNFNRLLLFQNKQKIISRTSGLGLHNLTTGSIPLVANKHTEGWGCKQFTIESSPLNTLTIFVVLFSQMKNEPSSEPATIYWPLLK